MAKCRHGGEFGALVAKEKKGDSPRHARQTWRNLKLSDFALNAAKFEKFVAKNDGIYTVLRLFTPLQHLKKNSPIVANFEGCAANFRNSNLVTLKKM